MTDPLEDSLRRVLHHRAGEVDTGPPVRPLDLSRHPLGPPRRVRRTWLAAVGSAAAVLAITVGALIGLRSTPAEHSPARPASPTTSHLTPTPPIPATLTPVPVPVPPAGSATGTPTATGTVTTPTPGAASQPRPTAAG